MANHWDISDAVLQQQLQAYIDQIISSHSPLQVRLFKNSYEPQPGSALGSYTEADFPGYAYQTINTDQFGAVGAAVAHVVSSLCAQIATFTAASSGFVNQPVYGYYITYGLTTYLYGESFGTAHIVVPSYQVTVQAQFKHTTYPNPV